LTARGDDVEKIVGLESGADDYLAKPFNPRELIARMRAILRRTNQLPRAGAPLVVGDITLDAQARDVSVNGGRVNLTSAEFTLLEALLSQPGRIVTRDALTETVLGRTLGPFDRVIDVHVSNLRRKLGPSPEGERIKAVRGSGYIFIVRSDGSAVPV
jgi:two-component system response regulator CpxR